MRMIAGRKRMTGTKEQGTTAGMLTTQETERIGKRTARRRNWAGILLGAGLALTLAVFAEPMEVQATTCSTSDSCVKFNDPDTTHTHSVWLQADDTIRGGHFTGKIWVEGTSTIEGGTFDDMIDVGEFGKNGMTLTIKNGNFGSSMTVYGKAVIENGTFHGITAAGASYGNEDSEVTINGGTFCSQLELQGNLQLQVAYLSRES